MYQFREKNTVSLFLSDLSLIERISSSVNKKIELYKHEELGKVLVINAEIQHVEAWAPLYHEIVVHLPCQFVKDIKKVMIIGGGSLYAAHEILKYDSVKDVVLIDFDEKVLHLIERNYSHAGKILSDKRFQVVTAEAFSYLEKNDAKFDFILNDSIDLYNHSKRFVTKNAFGLLTDRLTRNGVCSDVILRHIFERKTTIKTIAYLRKKFRSAFSLLSIPEYPGILHLLSMWGKNKSIQQNAVSILNDEQKEWISNPKQNPCEIYNPQFLPFYLHLPPYLRKAVLI